MGAYVFCLMLNLSRDENIFISSAIAGILLESPDFNFFFSKILVVILKNSDILFDSKYKRET